MMVSYCLWPVSIKCTVQHYETRAAFIANDYLEYESKPGFEVPISPRVNPLGKPGLGFKRYFGKMGNKIF